MSPVVNTVMSADIERLVRKYRRSVVNSLLEYLVLTYLEGTTMCGYDIITLLHERFHTLLSPGQVYPVIDYMAEHGLISKRREGRAVMLSSTPLGESLLRAWREEFSLIQMQLKNIAACEIQAVTGR